MDVFPVFTSMSEMTNFGSSDRKRRGPEKFAVVAVQHEDAAGFTDGDDDVALLAGPDCGVDPLHVLRIGTDARAHQRAFMRVVGVPVVAGQMLVVPGELAGVRIRARSSNCCRGRRALTGKRRRGCRRAVPMRWSGIGLATPQ